MDQSKSLFGESCEGGNALASMLGSLMNQENPHQYSQMIGHEFEDLWEANELQDPGDLIETWNQVPEPAQNYEGLWETAQNAPEDNFEEVWQNKEPNQFGDDFMIKDSAAEIMSVLSRQSDPKFQNSEFYQFLEKISTNKVKIQNNQVIENFEDVWSSSNPVESQGDRLGSDIPWNTLTQEEQARFNDIWKNTFESNTEDEEKLISEWGKAWETTQEPQEYQISTENPYVDLPNAFELGLQRMNEENYKEAILMIEAELIRTPEHSEAWLVLGRIFSDLDRDDKAAQCLKQGLQHDPYNLNLILSLATSSINTFDHSSLISYFSQWLKNNFEYSGLVFAEPPTVEALKNVFFAASEMNPRDFNVYVCLGLLSFVENNFFEAENYFRIALELNQNDYDIINKLGVCVMKQSRLDEADQLFAAAVTIKPGFVKGWANMAKNLVSSGNFQKGVEAYLSAALVNGEEHLFEHLRSAFVLNGREDLISKLEIRDPFAFADEFQIRLPKKPS